MKHKTMNFLSTVTTEEDDLPNKQITGIRSTCKTIRSIILRRNGEQLVMPHATTFQAQLCNQTQGLALHRQYSEQTLNTGISQQSNYLLLTEHGNRKKHSTLLTARASHSKISNACLLANINEQILTRFSNSNILN